MILIYLFGYMAFDCFKIALVRYQRLWLSIYRYLEAEIERL